MQGFPPSTIMAKVVLALHDVHHRHRIPSPRWSKPWGYRLGPGIVNVSLDLHEGAVLGLVGPNGAGKTTLLRLMAGLLPVQQGRITGRFGSKELQPVTDLRPYVGHMPEQVRWQGRQTVREALMELAEMRHVGEKRVLGLLQLVGLSQRQDEPLNNLSQGMRQRLSIAAALLGSPKVLLLDEPYNGLDPVASRAFTDLIRRLATKGVSVVISSHMVSQLNGLIDRVALLHQGQLLDEGSMKDVEQRLGLGGRHRVSGQGEFASRMVEDLEIEHLEIWQQDGEWTVTFRGEEQVVLQTLVRNDVVIDSWGPVEPDLVEWLCAATGLEPEDITLEVQAPSMMPFAQMEARENE